MANSVKSSGSGSCLSPEPHLDSNGLSKRRNQTGIERDQTNSFYGIEEKGCTIFTEQQISKVLTGVREFRLFDLLETWMFVITVVFSSLSVVCQAHSLTGGL